MSAELTELPIVDRHEPLVSVVMPTHNRAKLLEKAIRSVLSQTYKNLEIIVVDDASCDNTSETVKTIQDERVRYIRHETNKGGSAARNSGILLARGEYIAFLDDDDEWEPEKTEQQLKVLESCDAVLCTSNEPGSGSAKLDSKKTVDIADLRKGLFTAGGTGALMARSTILKDTLFDEKLPKYQDWDLFIRLAQKCVIGYLNKRLVRYNEGTHHRISNRILNMPARELESQLRMLEKHKEFFGDAWYRRHMSWGMLYGIKQRTDKLSQIMFTIRRYGIASVANMLINRTWQKIAEHWKRYV
jgi:glycosyltransferase involved in cell wall biosynthesis